MDPRVRIGAGPQASQRGLWLLLVLAMAGANAGPADVPAAVEVFTTADQSLATADAVGSVSVKVHELDGIQRVQAELSQGLPRQSEAALPIAQARIATLDAVRRREVQDSAVALARAAQLGIDRYPAIVFDGRAVVYGVTDVGEALRRYRQWQDGAGR
jgi:integrating conjugative element protein (TIGR03757 family)